MEITRRLRPGEIIQAGDFTKCTSGKKFYFEALVGEKVEANQYVWRSYYKINIRFIFRVVYLISMSLSAIAWLVLYILVLLKGGF